MILRQLLNLSVHVFTLKWGPKYLHFRAPVRIKYNHVCKVGSVHCIQQVLSQVCLPSLLPSNQLPLPEDRVIMRSMGCRALPQQGDLGARASWPMWGQAPRWVVLGHRSAWLSACQVLSLISRVSPLASFSFSQWLISADCGLLFSLSFSELPTGFFFPSQGRAGDTLAGPN